MGSEEKLKSDSPIKDYDEEQKKLFRAALHSKEFREILLDEVRINIFEGSLSVVYDLLVKYQFIDEDLLSKALDLNKKVLTDSQYAKAFEATMKEINYTEFFTVLKNSILDDFRGMLSGDVAFNDTEEFSACIKLLKDQYTTAYYTKTIESLQVIMGNGEGLYDQKTRKMLSGIEDAEKFRIQRMEHLNEVNAIDRPFEHIVLDEKQVVDAGVGKNTGEVIATFDIPEIDDAMNGIRGGNLVAILGAPKGGKTSTLIYLTLQAVLKKQNVLVWITEAEWYEWEAGLLAAYYMHKTSKRNEKDEKSELSSTTILNNTPKYISTIASLRVEFYTDSELGRVQFIKGDCIAEEFVSILKSKEKSYPFNFLVFDTPVLAVSESMDKYIAIGYVIKAIKSYLSNHRRGKCAGVMSAQFKQSVIDIIRRNPDKEVSIEAGGDSAEVARTPDYIWGVFANEAERNLNRQNFYGMGSRHTQLPKKVEVGMDYGAKYLYSIKGITK